MIIDKQNDRESLLEVLLEVLQLLVDFCDVSMAVTTDIWSSCTKVSYILLTAHFVDKHFQLHRYKSLEHQLHHQYCHHHHHNHHHQHHILCNTDFNIEHLLHP